MNSHRRSPRRNPYLSPLAYLVSALLLLSLLGWSGIPATSAPGAPVLTLHSPAPGELHLEWVAATPPPLEYHIQYAPTDTPLLIEEATAATNTLTLYDLEPGVVYTVQVRAGTGPWSTPVLQRIDDYRADPETVGTIGVGAEEEGYIESAGDADWFFIDLTAGEGYPIAVMGATAPSLAVYDATGSAVQQGLAWHQASALTFTPATAGLYHLAVGGPAAAPGPYTLTVAEPPTAEPRRSRTLAGAEPTAPPAPRSPAAVPAKPRGLEATASYGEVVLTWEDPDDDSITGYVILRRVRENNVGGAFGVLVANTGSAATTYTDDTVEAETRYTYRIKAINEHGESERSRWVHIDTPSAPVPAEPKGLSATASDDRVVLTWEDPDDDSITGYVILRRNRDTDVKGHFDELVANTGSAATTYTDDTVEAETRYTYRIKAINEYGESERSRWFHIDTLAAPEATFGDDPVGAPGHGTPGGAGTRANVSEPDGEDFPATILTTGEVDVGGWVTGMIGGTDSGGDWFKVDLVASTRYQFDMEGEDTNRGTLGDPYLQLRNTSGSILSGTGNDDGGVGVNAREFFTPANIANETLYIATDAAQNTTGTYRLSVIVLGANGNSEADADFSDNTSTAGRVDVGASATGTIATILDFDWFAVDLEANTTYQIDLYGAFRDRGTLRNPELLDIRDSSGNEIAGTGNNDIDKDNDWRDSRTVFRPTATGTYYLVAGGNTGTGTYRLSVREVETLVASDGPPGGLGPSDVPGPVRDIEVSYSRTIGQTVSWDAPDETTTGAQWITEFHIYGSASKGCGGRLLDEYEVEHPGFSTPPTDSNGNTGFKYFKRVNVGPVKFGVAAVNGLGEGPCVDGPAPPTYEAFTEEEIAAFDEMVGLTGCPENAADLWCGVVTVGEILSGTNTFAYGFLDVSALSAGSFDGDTEITIGANTYTFTGLYVPVGGSFEGHVILRANDNFTGTDQDNLELHLVVDGTVSTWPMSEFEDSTNGQMIAQESDFDWSSATTVVVRLRTADNN